MNLRGIAIKGVRWIAGAMAGCCAFSAAALDLAATNTTAIGIKGADWSQPSFVPKFDQTYGTLTGVELRLTATIRSTPRMENLDAVSRTLVGGSTGTLTVSAFGSATPMVITQGSVTITNTVTAFDGYIDWGGVTGNYGSGFSAPPISAEATAAVQLQPGSADFLAFVGDGSGTKHAKMGFSGTAVPIATGAASINALIASEVGASLTVIYHYTPFVASVAGKVWVDVNRDGIVTPGEPGLPGVTVGLLDAGGFPVAGVSPQVTDSNGAYQFTNLVMDPAIGYDLYSVAISQPVGYVQDYDLDDGLNSTPASPLVATFYLNYNEDKGYVNFGFINGGGGQGGGTGSRVRGLVWLDVNGNGFQDPTEVGIGGVQVMLLDGVLGGILATRTTDATGHYRFDGVAAGSYRIRVVPTVNYVNYAFSVRNVNGNPSDMFDSDVDINSGISGLIRLSGLMDVQVDAGLVPVLLDNCVDETQNTASAPLCGSIRTAADWKGWSANYTASQFQAIIANTAHYKTLSTSAVVAVLGDNSKPYNQSLMAAELSVSAASVLGSGIYTSGTLSGSTVSSILALAYSTPSASAPAYLTAAIAYLGSGGKGNALETCLVVDPSQRVPAGRAFTLSGIATDLVFDPAVGRFQEGDGGDAQLIGFVQSRSNPANGFSVAITFSGYTPVPPAGIPGSPKMDLPPASYIQNGGPIDPATWSYYTSFSGTMTGVGAYAGSLLLIANSGPSFQVGYGANGLDLNWGAAGWLRYTVVNQAVPTLPATGTGALSLDLNNCPSGGAMLCRAMLTTQKLSGSELQLTVLNQGTTDIILSGFDFNWPASLGRLKQVKFDSDIVYTAPALYAPAHVVAAQLVADLNKRTIKHGASDVIHLMFENKTTGTVLGDYSGSFVFGGCTVSIISGCSCNCNLGYPFNSANPLTSVVFNESEVLRLLEPQTASAGGTIRVFYNDEHAMLLGVRNGTTAPVTPMTSNPGHVVNPAVGDLTARDPSGRPLFPALFITDVTGIIGTTSDAYRAGDWQYGGTPIPPHEIFGTWKAAVKSTGLLATDMDPVGNGWNLGAGSDTPAGGFTALTNQGYGTEIRWNVNSLRVNGQPLQSGHSYRVQVMVHDGDQNKSGGDVGQSCMVVTIQ